MVPHLRLLLKLKSYGIGGNLLSWINSFLTGRLQRVTLNSVYSEWSSVVSGIPQGSVFGPVLFLLYVNDISSIVNSHLLLFADDIKLYRSIKSEMILFYCRKTSTNYSAGQTLGSLILVYSNVGLSLICRHNFKNNR